MGPCRDERDGTEVRIHGGVVGSVSGDDDSVAEPDGETGGDDGVGWVGRVIPIYSNITFTIYSTHDDCESALLRQFREVAFRFLQGDHRSIFGVQFEEGGQVRMTASVKDRLLYDE